MPLFLFELGSPVHGTLTAYKAGVTPARRAACVGALADLLREWLCAHTVCMLAGRREALVVPVPSSRGGRPSWSGRHPLEMVGQSALDDVRGLRLQPVLVPGTQPPGRLRASAGGYEVTAAADVAGRAVIVLDDMLVSGARLASAAAALSAAGARVLAAVPLGRLVRPHHNDATAAFWEDRHDVAAELGCCTLCGRRPVRTTVPMRLAGVSARLAA